MIKIKDSSPRFIIKIWDDYYAGEDGWGDPIQTSPSKAIQYLDVNGAQAQANKIKSTYETSKAEVVRVENSINLLEIDTEYYKETLKKSEEQLKAALGCNAAINPSKQI